MKRRVNIDKSCIFTFYIWMLTFEIVAISSPKRHTMKSRNVTRDNVTKFTIAWPVKVNVLSSGYIWLEKLRPKLIICKPRHDKSCQSWLLIFFSPQYLQVGTISRIFVRGCQDYQRLTTINRGSLIRIRRSFSIEIEMVLTVSMLC